MAARILEGGEILAPGSPKQLLQFIDVRDLAKWIVSMIERKETGFYNATGPASPLSFEELLKSCAEISNNALSITWINEDFLIEHEVQDWTELPLWLSYKRNMPGFFHVNTKKSHQCRAFLCPLKQTISSIIEWEEHHKDPETQTGLDPKKEQEILKLWQQNLNH